MSSIDLIRERLSEIRPHGMSRDILNSGMVRDVTVEEGRVTVQLQTGPLPPPIVRATVDDIRRAVGALPGVRDVDVRISNAPAADLEAIPEVAEILAVSSTKGGVGKSTVAVNLACALVASGRKVGLLDADVYGPSLPTMIGLAEQPRVGEGNKVYPLEKYGLRVMSMGFFLDDSSPVIWRGPLVTGLLRQFLKDVIWGELDILVIDLPPGTGDAQLTLVQQVPLSGALVVTTPQDVSLLDVERGIAMFQQVNTPVIGVVENMSYYECPKCGERDEVFGSGGGARLEQRLGVPLLAQIPLLPEIRASGDAGCPLMVENPQHPVARIYADLAERVGSALVEERAAAPAPRIIG
jgi:ATP-binding protein involved in chromosome partitioning